MATNVACFAGRCRSWSSLLWVVARRRDRDAVLDKKLEKAAADKALRSRVLVYATLPQVAMEAIRARLLQNLPPSVAYNVNTAVLMQSDIVVRSGPFLV